MLRLVFASLIFLICVVAVLVVRPDNAQCEDGQLCASAGYYTLEFESAELNGAAMTSPTQVTEVAGIQEFDGTVQFYTDLVEAEEYRHLDVEFTRHGQREEDYVYIYLMGDKTCCAGLDP